MDLSSSTRAWAQRLLAVEAAKKSVSDDHEHEVLRVFDKLRCSLTQFVGADGFTALARRALALARADTPALQTARVTAEGRLEGLESTVDASAAVEGATAVTAHLLGLLITFIGEPLTLRVVRQVWPEELNRNTESKDFR